MSSEGSITRCIALLKAGDRAAAQRIWEAYSGRLVALARKRLRSMTRRVADEEDAVLSAFDSFFRRAGQGQFPRLTDRGDLWQLLVVITVRKAANLARYEGRPSRGAGRVRTIDDLAGEDVAISDPEPSPQVAAVLAEECQRRLDALEDATLRRVAIWRLEGYTNAEIAARLGCVEQTVDRKLRAIRRLWSGEPPP
jgi:DNA-directed RNA polymerase specialized sigma24 family protein